MGGASVGGGGGGFSGGSGGGGGGGIETNIVGCKAAEPAKPEAIQ